jgi:hypothetical protein
MIETYRMLGREHEADLAREAKRRQQASLVQLKVRRRRPVSIPRWISLHVGTANAVLGCRKYACSGKTDHA